MKRKTIRDAIELAKTRHFELLSADYVNSKTLLVWKCNQCGHIWRASYNNVYNGSGCPKCAGTMKLTKEHIEAIAGSKSIQFLPDEYKNSMTKHRWKCLICGYEWEATPSQILHQDQSCPRCVRCARRTYEELLEIINQKGGKLKTPKTKYLDTKSKVRITCSCGWSWSPNAASIFQGKWCPKCGNSLKTRFGEIEREAKRRGGECLCRPDEYRNNKSRLTFRCACGNVFAKCWNDIQQGKWCPKCSASREERICRDAFEQYFEKPFITCWPDWLRNDEGNALQLDGFNEELRIAFEYQGKQHYSFTKKFYTGIDDLEKRKRDDETKKKICASRGIRLFVIKYCQARRIEDVFDEVVGQIEEQSRQFELDCSAFERDFNPYKFFQTPLDLYKLRELVEIATSRHGMLMDTEYRGVNFHYTFKCLIHGKIWKATANMIKNEKTWCKDCGYEKVSRKLRAYRRGRV